MRRGRTVLLLTLVLLVSGILVACSPAKGTAEWYALEGGKLGEEGCYDEAIEHCSEAIQLDPNLVRAYYNRGTAYLHKGQYGLAIADYAKAIELDPKLAKAYVNRAWAYNDIGQYDLAIADCNKAIELDPKLAKAYVNRGNASAGLG